MNFLHKCKVVAQVYLFCVFWFSVVFLSLWGFFSLIAWVKP